MEYEYKTQPFAHQKQVFEASRDKEYFGLLMEQGTGKSKVFIDTACYNYHKGHIDAVVVVVPKSIARNWSEKEIRIHAPAAYNHEIAVWDASPKKKEREALEKIAKRRDTMHLRWLIVNADALNTEKGFKYLKTFLSTFTCMLGVDESTLFKNVKAGRVKMLMKLAPLAKYRRIMTGTPVANRPLDVFAQFEILKPGCLDHNNFFTFKHRYGIIRKMVLPTHSFDRVVGYQRLPELQQNIEKVSFRVLKSDCLDLPPKTYLTRYVELSDEQRRIYNEIADNAMTIVKDQTIITPVVLTQLLRLRQVLCGIVPTDANDGSVIEIEGPNYRLKDLLQCLDEISGKALIWCPFVPVLKSITAAIEKEYGEGYCAAFHGGVSAEERNDLVNKFQDPGSAMRTLAIQPRTGGYGLTLTEADNSFYYANDYSLEVRLQSEARPDRIGQTKPITYTDFIASGTVDEDTVEMLLEKKDLAEQVTGDRLQRLFRRV